MQSRVACEHHSEIAYRVNRLSTRMDRIELGIVGVLIMLVAQLWLLLDLPGRIQDDRRLDAPKVATGIVNDAHAEE